MKPSKLAIYLDDLLPHEVPYDDLAAVCLRIYCNLDGLPPEIVVEPLDKERIADAFAWLAKKRNVENYPLLSSRYGASFHKTTDKGHWLEVIASIFKNNLEFDESRANELINLGIGGNQDERTSHS